MTIATIFIGYQQDELEVNIETNRLMTVTAKHNNKYIEKQIGRISLF